VSNFSLAADTCIATVADPSSALLGNITELDVDGLAVALAPYALHGSVDPRVAVAVSFSAGSLVFGAAACVLDSSSGGAAGLNDAACFSGGALTAPTTLPLLSHVGAQPSVALGVVGAGGGGGGGGGGGNSDVGLALLEAHAKSSCFNSEPRNKDALVGLCDAAPVRFSGASYVAYASAPVAAWAAELLATADLARAGGGGGGHKSAALPTPWPGASCCSTSVAHGSVGTGGAPAAALLALPGGGLAAAVALERPTSTNDPLQCGASAPAAAGAPPLALLAWPVSAIGA